MHRESSLCVIVIAWISFSSVEAAPQPLTMEEAVQLALKNNVRVHSSRADIQAIAAKRKAVRGALLPKLSVEGNVFVWDDELSFDVLGDMPAPISGCEATMACMLPLLSAFDFGPVREQITSQITVQLTQPITPLYQIYKGYQAVKLGERAARAGLRLSRSQVANEATKAYIRVKQAGAGVRIATAAVTQVEAQLKTARAFHKAGILGLNEVLKVQLGLAQARGAYIQATTGEQLARTALALQLGLPAGRAINAVEQFADPPPALSLSFAQCLQRAHRSRPEMMAVTTQIEIARASKQAAFGGLIPRLAAVAAYQHSEGMGFAMPKNAFFFGGAVNWSFNWGQDYYAYKEAGIKSAKAKLQLTQLKDGIHLQVKRAFLQLTTARQQLTISRSAVKQAQEAYRIEKKKYEGKSATTTDLLTAQVSLNNAKLTHNNALYSWYLARAELAAAMGDSLDAKDPVQ